MIHELPDRKPSALDLYWLADHTPDLAEARLKGTPRPWRQSQAWDSETRAAMDAAARAERAERSDAAIGEHPAPLHLDTMELLVDLLATADWLAELVSQHAGVERLPTPASSFADPVPYLRHAAHWLQDAYVAEPAVAFYVERESARLRTEVSVALNLVTDGQTLKAECPWCCGVTETHPGGGAFTLRVRTLPGGETAIVCHGLCDPPESDVGAWWRGKPAWPLATEGAWLADRLARHAGEEGVA